jgi:hypothetical protein
VLAIALPSAFVHLRTACITNHGQAQPLSGAWRTPGCRDARPHDVDARLCSTESSQELRGRDVIAAGRAGWTCRFPTTSQGHGMTLEAGPSLAGAAEDHREGASNTTIVTRLTQLMSALYALRNTATSTHQNADASRVCGEGSALCVVCCSVRPSAWLAACSRSGTLSPVNAWRSSSGASSTAIEAGVAPGMCAATHRACTVSPRSGGLGCAE